MNVFNIVFGLLSIAVGLSLIYFGFKSYYKDKKETGDADKLSLSRYISAGLALILGGFMIAFSGKNFICG